MTIRKQKVWAIIGQKGGDGKSTVAYALSYFLARKGSKTALIDVDRPQFSSVLLSKLWDLEASKKTDGPVKPKLSFDLLRCQNSRDIPRISEGYEAIVFDGAPHASVETLNICRTADCIVIPTRTYTINLKPAFDIAAELTANGIDKRKIIFLISQALSDSEVRDARETIAARGYRVASEDLRTYAAYGKAGNAGRSVLEVSFPTLRERAETIFTELANT